MTWTAEQQREYLREWKRNRTPEQRARYRKQDQMTRRLKVYGLTPAQFDEMLIEQEGKCKICQNVMQVPCVDHDHEHTDLIRGLLCYDCNIGIGRLGDDPARVQRAVLYLLGMI